MDNTDWPDDFYWKPLEKHSFTHTTSSTEEQTASSITFVCLTKAAQKWMPTWFKMFQTIYAIIYLKSFTSMFFCALQEEPWQSVIKGNLWIKPWLTSVCLSHSVQQWISSRSLFFFFFFSMTLLKSIPHKEGMGTQILQLNTYYSNIKGKTRGKVQCRWSKFN